MFDRLLVHGLTLAILGLISAACGGGLYLMFAAWSECLGGQWPAAMGHVAGALVCAIAVWWLCVHREELADA